jgi:hypothetical protein
MREGEDCVQDHTIDVASDQSIPTDPTSPPQSLSDTSASESDTKQSSSALVLSKGSSSEVATSQPWPPCIYTREPEPNQSAEPDEVSTDLDTPPTSNKKKGKLRLKRKKAEAIAKTETKPRAKKKAVPKNTGKTKPTTAKAVSKKTGKTKPTTAPTKAKKTTTKKTAPSPEEVLARTEAGYV